MKALRVLTELDSLDCQKIAEILLAYVLTPGTPDKNWVSDLRDKFQKLAKPEECVNYAVIRDKRED